MDFRLGMVDVLCYQLSMKIYGIDYVKNYVGIGFIREICIEIFINNFHRILAASVLVCFQRL